MEVYDAYRPRYPRPAIALLEQRFGLGPGRTVADIGAGTGLLTEGLIETGAAVIAVEPNEAMRRRCAQKLGERAQVCAGSAEATGLSAGSVDLVVAGQAFHWFDVEAARAEFSRILKPGGQVVLLWNERLHHHPLMKAYAELLRTWERERDKSTVRDKLAPALTQFYGAYSFEDFPHAQGLDRDGLIGRVFSSSYMPAPGDADYAGAKEAVEALFEAHAYYGRVHIDYVCRVYFRS